MTRLSSSSSMVKSKNPGNTTTPSLKTKQYNVAWTTGRSWKHKQRWWMKWATRMWISSTLKNQKHSSWLRMSTKCNQSNRKCHIRTSTSAWSRHRASHVSGRSRSRGNKRRWWKKQSSATLEQGGGSWWKIWIQACTSNKLQTQRYLYLVVEAGGKFELRNRRLELAWMIMWARTV